MYNKPKKQAWFRRVLFGLSTWLIEARIMENDHLTEIHLIEIVIFQLIEIFNN
jgi:hypothetical protein